jgi:tripartite-type tricarboxylate transporter receptor subunit TctC
MQITRRSALAKLAVPAFFAAALATMPAGNALAQAWPAKPIRLIVPFPAGGGTDIIAREVANRLTLNTRWTFVVENRPGSGGNLGVDAAAKSAPDGYSLVLGQTSNLAINPTLYSKLPYDPLRDLTPVSLVGSSPMMMVVAADLALQDTGRPGRQRPKPNPVRSTTPRRATARWRTWPPSCSSANRE